MKVYNQENEHHKVLVKVLKYCRKIHEVLFGFLLPVQSRGNRKHTLVISHSSLKNCCVKGAALNIQI